MSDLKKQDDINSNEVDFDILEINEATALEEMGASTTIGAGSTCSGKTTTISD